MNYKETGRVSQTVCTGLVCRIFVSIKYLKNITAKQVIDRVKIKVSNFSQNGSFNYAFLNNKIEYNIFSFEKLTMCSGILFQAKQDS